MDMLTLVKQLSNITWRPGVFIAYIKMLKLQENNFY